MKASVVAAGAFAAGAVVLGWWLLSRPRPPAVDASAPLGGVDTPSLATFAFAAWASRADAVLLVEMEPEGSHFTPKRFHVVNVAAGVDGKATTTDGPFLSWAPSDRVQTTSALLDRGFPMTNDEYRPYPPAADPLSGEAPDGKGGGAEQTVLLRSKGGLAAVLRRHRGDALAMIVWGKRALAFPSSDGRLAYVIPDHVIVALASSASSMPSAPPP